MASYLQIENISKSYGPKVLFEKIGFNINEGDKIALIAPNGSGKTSLMRILAGQDKSDSGGKILFLKDIRIAFLEQEYSFDPENSIFEQILENSKELLAEKEDWEVWEYERKVGEILTNFKLSDFSQKMKELSGGEVKRVALSQMLASEADFFIMDEPTNHLDIDAIEYLEAFLSRSRCTLLMVTHDRYFLDKVCNTVMEMDKGAIYVYKGAYQNFLEKREERIANYNAETDKARNILRRELEWFRSTPQARTGKARYRINAFYDIKDRAGAAYNQNQLSMEGLSNKGTRLGTKIINCKNLSFYYDDECYIDNFTYNFQRYEKVGIVGYNGSGKTTFMNVITGAEHYGKITGEVDRGESLNIGYYNQNGMSFNPEDTVLDIVNDTALLNRFLFTHDMLLNKVEKLSGGEKRRLYLLTILMQKPNLLILDEPTNDLDIITLNILEEYLKEFEGTLIIVSHDRHFLDKLVDHLFIFCGKGLIKDFIGTYSEYREYIKDYEAEQRSIEKATKEKEKATTASNTANQNTPPPPTKKKLTFKEQQEFDTLEKDIADLEEEKSLLETSFNTITDYQEIQASSERIAQILKSLEEKEERWIELSLMIS